MLNVTAIDLQLYKIFKIVQVLFLAHSVETGGLSVEMLTHVDLVDPVMLTFNLQNEWRCRAAE